MIPRVSGGLWRQQERQQRASAAARAAKRRARRRAVKEQVTGFDMVTLEQTVTDEEPGSITKKLTKMAALRWSTDYAPLIAQEHRKLASIGLMNKSAELKAAAPPSSYTARGLTRNVEQKAEKITVQAGDLRWQPWPYGRPISRYSL
jgi:hypothetical protein